MPTTFFLVSALPDDFCSAQDHLFYRVVEQKMTNESGAYFLMPAPTPVP